MRALFEAALEQPPAGRRAWLAAACGGDAFLAEGVERMLAAADQRHHFLDGLLDHGDDATREAASPGCRACGAALEASHQFCSSCGTPSSNVGPLHEGRFRAGALFAGRFRILGLQGRGGMGQVYRAQDLELGQTVALKFLTALQSNPRARSQLRTEVRLARQISHPNVCRVYDIGEANGELYLSMEYVDGEDLGALLKRIGRLPVHKGVDIARKLCAGLAAAHGRGVLHKDLKPSNVMIDSRGEARIMDFGLAAVAEQRLEAAEIRSGTPAYMAPEQLGGREATARSDIYALGLVLYEVFTGSPAFASKDPHELLRLREAHPSLTPSTLVPDLDPVVERVILRCLDPDPRMRPATALDVAKLLPGGDPLAEALAAGETPSPEMVAAAGPDVVMRPAVALGLLMLIGAGLTAILLLTRQVQLISMVPMENSPEVLASKARDLVRSLGYRDPPADVAYGFRVERGYLEAAVSRLSPDGSGLARWKAVLGTRPSPISFWYAQAEWSLVPPVAYTGVVRPIDALPTVRALLVDLDLDGRLLRFVAPGANERVVPAAGAASDWTALFAAAGLDLNAFEQTGEQQPAEPPASTRVSWLGSYPGQPDTPVRVEGTTVAGSLNSFDVLLPWTRRDPLQEEPINYPTATLSSIIWLAPCLVAWYNWRRGRADMRAAVRMGAFAFLTHLAVLLLRAHDALGAFVTRPLFWLALASGAWVSIVYVALEPWVRRWWPSAMIGWARVIAGRWHDPLVARDVLVALALAVAYRCVYLVAAAGAVHAGAPPLRGGYFDVVLGEFVVSNLNGAQFMAANVLSSILITWLTAAGSYVLLVSLRRLLRYQSLAVAGFCAVACLWYSNQPQFRGEGLMLLTFPILLAVWILITLRYGLLTLAITIFAYQLIAVLTLTSDFAAWYGRSSLSAVLLVSALAIWAFRVSIGSRPLWSSAPQW